MAGRKESDADFQALLFSQVTEITWKCCPPVIIILGTFGNVMTIVVIRRMREGQSSNTIFLYFTALALSDLIILYVGLLRKWVDHVFGVDVILLHDVLCKLHSLLINSCGMISAWLVVSMTTQRVISVVWSHHKNVSCTQRKVWLVINVIAVVFVALNCYRLHGIAVKNKFNSTTKVCETIDDDQIKYFDWYIFPWIDLVVTSLVPFGILIVGNSVLLRKVIQSVQVARVMTAGGCDQVNSRQKKALSLTVTLITVSFAFLILTVPICVYIILDPNFDTESGRSLSKLQFTWAVCNLSWYANSAVNFYLYCLSGTRFRREVRCMICRYCTLLTTISKSIIPMPQTGRIKHENRNEAEDKESDF